jgi:hypothetical protein
MDFLGEGVCLSFSLLSMFYLRAFINLRFVNLNKTLVKHIQNNQKSIGKSLEAYGF